MSSYALCVRDGAILLSRIAQGATADFDGMWTLPGGGVEFGEHPRDAAVRELREETGLEGEVIELATVDSWVGRFIGHDGVDTAFHSIRIVYRVRIVGGELRDEVGGTSDACAFFTREQAAELPMVGLGEIGIGLAFEGT